MIFDKVARYNVVIMADNVESAITYINISNLNANGYCHMVVTNNENIVADYKKWADKNFTKDRYAVYFVGLDVPKELITEDTICVKNFSDFFNNVDNKYKPQIWISEYTTELSTLYKIFLKNDPLRSIIEKDYIQLGNEPFIKLYCSGIDLNIQRRLKSILQLHVHNIRNRDVGSSQSAKSGGI